MAPFTLVLIEILSQYQSTQTLTHDQLGLINKNLKRFSASQHPVYQQIRQIINTLCPVADHYPIQARLALLIAEQSEPPTCKMCSNSVKWNAATKQFFTFCSARCTHQDEDVRTKTVNTNHQRYGAITWTSTPTGKALLSKKWADKSTDQIAEISASRKTTVIDRYGKSNPSQVDEIKAKKVATSLINYGTMHPMHNQAVSSKITASWEQKTPDQVSDIVNRREQTSLQQWGVANPSSSQTVRQKVVDTLVSKYGASNPNYINADMSVYELLTDRTWMHQQHVTNQQPLVHIANKLGISDGTVGRHLHNHGIKTHSFSRSMGERSVGEYVQSLGVECVFNDRSIIKPRELDIYIPSHNLAIEYCGVYWHSEQQGKDRQYHKSKMDQCNAHGIQLITMFEDEWFTRTEQVKRKLASLLNASSENAVFARKCQIVNVSTGDRVKFLDANHIQGDGSGSITHGLMHSGQLVAVMVWKRTSDRVWLLNRYATACKVPGGFSRLLEHFKQAVEWDQLVSFADLRWSDGSLYTNTGWTHSSTIPPDYSYSPDGIERYHKFNYRRKNLPNLLEYFDPNLSEWENCKANEVLRLWDCGKMRFTITA